MKKNLFYAIAFSLIIAFTACNKENSPQVKTFALTKKTLVNQPSYSYTDLVLDARPPGQNYDTYHATFSGVLLTVSGIYWDSATYPTLVNGVPAYGEVSVNPNTTIDGLVTPATGNGIGGAQATLMVNKFCGAPKPSLSDDIQKYETALTNAANTGVIPIIDDYVKGDYSNASGCALIAYNFKIIRCTTGTHFAIATGNYPYAPRANNSLGNPQALCVIKDPANASISYELYGSNSVITGYADGVGGSTGITVTGSYTAVPNNSTNFHCVGSVYRKDGTSFNFDVTQDIY